MSGRQPGPALREIPDPPPARSLDVLFSPVRSRTAFEETVERLGTAIRLGLLPPGTRLPAERELCARLGIARSTLRQALVALGRSGPVRAPRGRGGRGVGGPRRRGGARAGRGWGDVRRRAAAAPGPTGARSARRLAVTVRR